MAQRTVFPSIPNTAEGSYAPVLSSIFAELDRQGGSVPFKVFRSFLKERNIYDKEEVDELFAFLGCQTRPSFVLGDFGTKYLACDTPDKQQTALYLWVTAWNQFLPKYVFEALDVEGGGRLHSTHELYRLITSYVYAGEYVTLPNFQGWIRWMAATGYIKYIGIRWGLSELGKAEMANIRNIDVDELLEDEEEEAAAAEAGTAPPATPVVEAEASEAPAEASASDEEEDLPDMPPEPPIPDWEPPEAEAEEAEARPEPAKAPAKTTATPARTRVPDAKAGAVAPPVGWFDAAALGIDPKAYGAKPAVFLLELAVAARLATGPASRGDWRPFYRALRARGVMARFFLEGRDLSEALSDAGWFSEYSELLGRVVVDIMRISAALKADPNLPTTLEESADVGGVVWRLHERLFSNEMTAAPFWMVRAMYAMELWDNPTP